MKTKKGFRYTCIKCGKKFIRYSQHTYNCDECRYKRYNRKVEKISSIQIHQELIRKAQRIFNINNEPYFATKKEKVLYYIIPFLKKHKGEKFTLRELNEQFDISFSTLSNTLAREYMSGERPSLKREQYPSKLRGILKYRYWIDDGDNNKTREKNL